MLDAYYILGLGRMVKKKKQVITSRPSRAAKSKNKSSATDSTPSKTAAKSKSRKSPLLTSTYHSLEVASNAPAVISPTQASHHMQATQSSCRPPTVHTACSLPPPAKVTEIEEGDSDYEDPPLERANPPAPVSSCSITGSKGNKQLSESEMRDLLFELYLEKGKPNISRLLVRRGKKQNSDAFRCHWRDSGLANFRKEEKSVAEAVLHYDEWVKAKKESQIKKNRKNGSWAALSIDEDSSPPPVVISPVNASHPSPTTQSSHRQPPIHARTRPPPSAEMTDIDDNESDIEDRAPPSLMPRHQAQKVTMKRLQEDDMTFLLFDFYRSSGKTPNIARFLKEN